jgi:hypothetical protein
MKVKFLIVALFITSCLSSYQHGLLQSRNVVQVYDVKGLAAVADASTTIWPNIDEQPKHEDK